VTIFNQVFHLVFSVEASIAAAVFAIIVCVMAYALLRRRAGASVSPSRRSERNRLEVSYLGVLFGFVVFLVAFTAAENHRELIPQGKVTRRIDVTAYQWCWNFAYPGTAVTVTGDCAERHFPTLVVPVGQDVELTLHSNDVIHSFWVPALRYKEDVFPDHTNTIKLRINRAGTWLGRCAEYCGQQHYTMDFSIRAVPAAQFASWLKTAGHASAGAAA
jgi:cytochrome c oxidase subunit II